MCIEIVLFNPVIAQNTGSTARLAAANKLKLHLIEPLGFELTDKYLKRAGLDYWKYVTYEVHSSWKDFIKSTNAQTSQISIYSKKAEKLYYEARYQDQEYLVFGSETSGLPNELHNSYKDRCYKIPMEEEGVRSLNLATSVGIVVYEALRQVKYL